MLLLFAFSKPPPTLKKSSLDIPQRKVDPVTPSNYHMCQSESGRSSGGLGEGREGEQIYRGQRNKLPDR